MTRRTTNGIVRTTSGIFRRTATGGVVDDFEDKDITTKSPEWDGWTGDTGSLSAQNSTVLSGSFSGELVASSGSFPIVETTRDSTAQISEASILIRINDQPSDSNDAQRPTLRDGSGTFFASCVFFQNGDLETPSAGKFGSWSVDTTYKVRLFNIDYSAETYAVEVTDVGANTTQSDSGVSFSNSVNNMQSFEVGNDMNTSSSGATMFFDDVSVTI